MKERAIKAVTAQRQLEINSAKAVAEKNLMRALSIPEIADVHTKYVNLSFQASIKNNVSENDVNAALKEYRRILQSHGFSEDDFVYEPTCPVCGDTGSVNGKVCKCIWSEYIKALKAESKIEEKAKFTFADCKTDKIADETQRNALNSFYSFMKRYSLKIPDTKLKNIVFSGSTGTGKTCLASAVARNAVENGKSCVYLSAFEFNNEMLAAHTSPISERIYRLHDVLTADLLVIDDLGVEPMYKNVTREYLLLVLEERTRKGLCTLITTNLDEQNIQAKYGDRIFSRLSDKRLSQIGKFGGNDLRVSQI